MSTLWATLDGVLWTSEGRREGIWNVSEAWVGGKKADELCEPRIETNSMKTGTLSLWAQPSPWKVF